MWTHSRDLRLPAGASAKWQAGECVDRQAVLGGIARFLQVEDIHLNLPVATRDEFLETVGGRLERAHGLPCGFVAVGLARREALGSTALGHGVAIPHTRVRELNGIILSYSRPGSPIPFDSPDRAPVSDILVILVPKQATEEHLLILAEATQMLSDRDFRSRLEACRAPEEVKSLFDAWRR